MGFDFSGVLAALKSKASRSAPKPNPVYRQASARPQGGVPLAGGSLEALRKKYSQSTRGLARRQAIANQYLGR